MKSKIIVSVLVMVTVAFIGHTALANGYASRKGNVKGFVKAYAAGAGHERIPVYKARVRLYNKNGHLVKERKANWKGRFFIRNIRQGRGYYMKCAAKVPIGHNRLQTKFGITSRFRIKANRTVRKDCIIWNNNGF